VEWHRHSQVTTTTIAVKKRQVPRIGLTLPHFDSCFACNSRAFHNQIKAKEGTTMAQRRFTSCHRHLQPASCYTHFWNSVYPFQPSTGYRSLDKLVKHVTSKTFRAYLDAGRCRRDVSSHSTQASLKSWEPSTTSTTWAIRTTNPQTGPPKSDSRCPHCSQQHPDIAASTSSVDLCRRGRRGRISS
jgi:hypothetical protein